MSETAAELAQRAAQLPREEREWLLDALLVSLNEPTMSEIDAAWDAEIDRRVAEIERDEAALIPAEEVFAKARAIAR